MVSPNQRANLSHSSSTENRCPSSSTQELKPLFELMKSHHPFMNMLLLHFLLKIHNHMPLEKHIHQPCLFLWVPYVLEARVSLNQGLPVFSTNDKNQQEPKSCPNITKRGSPAFIHCPNVLSHMHKTCERQPPELGTNRELPPKRVWPICSLSLSYGFVRI